LACCLIGRFVPAFRSTRRCRAEVRARDSEAMDRREFHAAAANPVAPAPGQGESLLRLSAGPAVRQLLPDTAPALLLGFNGRVPAPRSAPVQATGSRRCSRTAPTSLRKCAGTASISRTQRMERRARPKIRWRRARPSSATLQSRMPTPAGVTPVTVPGNRLREGCTER